MKKKRKIQFTDGAETENSITEEDEKENQITRTKTCKQQKIAATSNYGNPIKKGDKKHVAASRDLSQFWNSRCKELQEQTWIAQRGKEREEHMKRSRYYKNSGATWYSMKKIKGEEGKLQGSKILSKNISIAILKKARIDTLAKETEIGEKQKTGQDKREKMLQARKIKRKEKKEEIMDTSNDFEIQNTKQVEEIQEDSELLDLEKQKKLPAERVIKYLLNPTLEQKKKLRIAFAAARVVYNALVYKQRNPEFMLCPPIEMNLKSLRAYVMKKESPWVKDNRWTLDIPYSIRDQALQDFLQSHLTNIAKKKKRYEDGKPAHHYKIQYRRNVCVGFIEPSNTENESKKKR